MTRLSKAINDHRLRREEYRNSIHFAITHAISESDRNELMMLASAQGVSV